jgi:hypothetical protein
VQHHESSVTARRLDLRLRDAFRHDTVAMHPSSPAANATPWAWMPALAATTLWPRSASDSLAILLYAPRTFNQPVRCRFSHFKKTDPATASDNTPRVQNRGLGDHVADQLAGGRHVVGLDRAMCCHATKCATARRVSPPSADLKLPMRLPAQATLKHLALTNFMSRRDDAS